MGDVTPLHTKARAGGLSAPAPINADHLVGGFSCGKPPLDDWLRYRAVRAEGRSARTYVTCQGKEVVGYYCLATGAVRLDELPKKLGRNMPVTVPVVLIGRLAVSSGYKGLGIGKGLLKDALLRAAQISNIAGCRAVMVHAIDDDASTFYLSRGFMQFPAHSKTFFLPLESIVGAV